MARLVHPIQVEEVVVEIQVEAQLSAAMEDQEL
jgi:hypothetical protein